MHRLATDEREGSEGGAAHDCAEVQVKREVLSLDAAIAEHEQLSDEYENAGHEDPEALASLMVRIVALADGIARHERCGEVVVR